MQGVFGGGVGWYDLFLRFIGAEPVGQTDPAFISVHSVGICGYIVRLLIRPEARRLIEACLPVRRLSDEAVWAKTAHPAILAEIWGCQRM